MGAQGKGIKALNQIWSTWLLKQGDGVGLEISIMNKVKKGSLETSDSRLSLNCKG